MKQRFSSLDVKVIAHELSTSVCSLRVANIYDLSTRIFLFKFQKPNHREQLVVDSGFRCHLTAFSRTTATAPSPFVVRLRKFLKTRRVTKISQVGTDRIIELQFSDGLYRLYLEFYAGGNIILTDADLNILALLRTVEEGAEHERLRVGLQYNLSLRQNYNGVPELTKERVREGLQKALEKQQEATDKKSKRKGKDALRKALAVSITELPPMLVDHAFAVTNFDATVKPDQVLEDDSLMEQLMKALEAAKDVDIKITSAETAKGFIIAKKKEKPSLDVVEDGSEAKAPTEQLLYEDFHPFRPQQFEGEENTVFLEFEGFNKTVDEFFSSIEGQKLESRLQEKEETAKRKLEQARKEHANRIGGLQQVQELNVRKAEAIQANVERVQEAMDAVNGLIQKGMDWVEIDRLIEREQKHGNPVAEMIKLPLKLRENVATLLLAEPGVDDEDEDFEGNETESESESDEEEEEPVKKSSQKPADKRLTIDVDLELSPWSNAKNYFDQKKSAAVKEEKTMQASQMALKRTEAKISADLRKGLKQEKEVLRPVRKQYWFEKFMYFLSSDGYLVLGGKDAQQNEILYRRYLKKGDIYVHADLNNAASVIIKNNPQTPDAPIPPSTLSQAGNLCVSTSSAWDSKAVMSAWWVNADQVSKTASTGEYLAAGGFTVRGKKNFLPPAQLLLGFAVLFQISEESKANHVKHRLNDGISQPATASQQEPLAGGSNLEPNADEPADDDESDSDEDFPDAKLNSADEESDEEKSPEEERSNPLQSTSEATEQAVKRSSSPEEDKKEEDVTAPAQALSGNEEEAHEKDGSSVKSEAPANKGKRFLSARERRLVRKGVDPDEILASRGADGSDGEADAGSSAAATETAAASKGNSAAPKPKQAPLPRGKRAKAKKLAQKYADQDEEDRELALRLLGAKKPGEGPETKAQEDKPSKEEEQQAQKQRRREQHLRAQEKGLAEEEKRRAALEGEVHEPDELDEEAARLEQVGLDAFTGRPLVGDEIVAAIPVCAPWMALAPYKYKVKLQPGATKKGKAVKEILGKWDAAFKEPRWTDRQQKDVERIWPREVECIKAWKETEVYGVVPVSKVRVVLSGGQGGGGGGKEAAKGKTKPKSGRGGRGSKKK
ncbi:uncharacterized protein K452DRAFT_8073 [Aplosporella prunicola CBS 121167]|uniref:Ribosome quality control complex subunit 2 n=1 Tax=Aplosporella prunicola CBS 121167 TaxID=1176127 RepID=A0A6A6BTS5_9PEZI|nr:uncharacterized protein K452DRAFT_8073 [Aplosporella prunicola CBS 121167]KAF2147486.1 hypothetical protein K452DRAFT_8073 [Aplosporella prunicola CBS 121167]